MVIRAYVAHERLPVGQLYILRRGLVVKLWRFLGTGKVWGEDIILDVPELIDHSQAVGLTYAEAYTLRRNDLDEVLHDFPLAATRVHKAARRITMQRALLKYLCEVVEGRSVRSFATRSAARGFTEVRSGLTLEQKVDVLVREHDMNTQQRREEARAQKVERSVSQKSHIAHGEHAGEASAAAGQATTQQLADAVRDLDRRQTAALEQLGSAQEAIATQLRSLTEVVAAMRSQPEAAPAGPRGS